MLPPDVNESGANFNVSDGSIRFGLAAVKNVGAAAIESIIESRDKNGKFKTLYDFCEQVNTGKVNKKTLEALIKCGAFDSTNVKRSQLMVVFEDALEHGSRIQREKADEQLDLFADTDMGAEIPVSTPKLPDIDEWDDHQLLEYEKESLGFYISGHPLDKYKKIIKQYADVNSVSIHNTADGKMIRMAGSIKILKLHKTKKGDMMAFCAIEDQSGSVEIVVFPELYAKSHLTLSDERIVIAEAKVQKKENIVKLIASRIVPLEPDARERTSGVFITLDPKNHTSDMLKKIKTILQKHPGDAFTCLKIKIDGNRPVVVKLGDEYKTGSDAGFIKEISSIVGKDSIEIRPVKAPVRVKMPWLKKKVLNQQHSDY